MQAENVVGTGIALVLGLMVTALMWAIRLYGGQIKDQRLRAAVQTFVAAAEQLYTSESGATKLDWVFGELRKQFPGLDAGLLRAMIEQAVLSLNLYAGQAGTAAAAPLYAGISRQERNWVGPEPPFPAQAAIRAGGSLSAGMTPE